MSLRPVRLSPAVGHDLDRLASFLAETNERAAIRSSELITDAILSLAEFAERGRSGRREGWRELVVRFGAAAYVIQYWVEPATVFVARVFHSREQR